MSHQEEKENAVDTAIAKAKPILEPFGFNVESASENWGLDVNHPEIEGIYFIPLKNDNSLDMKSLYQLPVAIAELNGMLGRNKIRKDLTEILKLETEQ